MKKILTILCLICLAQTSYAALDRNYFEYDLSPNGTYSEAEDTENVTTQTTIQSQNDDSKTTITRKRKRGYKGTGSSPSNTYWDFGRPNYGFTGDIQ